MRNGPLHKWVCGSGEKSGLDIQIWERSSYRWCLKPWAWMKSPRGLLLEKRSKNWALTDSSHERPERGRTRKENWGVTRETGGTPGEHGFTGHQVNKLISRKKEWSSTSS